MAAASNEPLCLARMVLAVVVVFGLACGRSMLSLPDSACIALPDDGGVSAVCPCTVSVESPAGNWVDSDPTGTPCSLVGAACHYLGWGSSGCGLTDCACMASEYGFHWACWGPLCY